MTTVALNHRILFAVGGAFVTTTFVSVISIKTKVGNTLADTVNAATLTAHGSMADSVEAEGLVSVDNVFVMRAGLETPALAQWTLLPAWPIIR